MTAGSCAQRRPGREPRRHGGGEGFGGGEPERSTKAGARTPATLTMPESGVSYAFTAQRRPGREPRRHPCYYSRARAHRPDRSTKAGARTPATRGVEGGRHNPLDRSTKAGARTPATLLRLSGHCSPRTGAQRRPGREPRRHLFGNLSTLGSLSRSTKAGARTPATRWSAARMNEQQARSTKAGARTPATLEQRRTDARREVPRSTKAGARTPATHFTASARSMSTDRAQRRPGREPRRHLDAGGRRRAVRGTLNEGRGANPGDTCVQPMKFLGVSRRSTKAGARTPATPGRAGPAPGSLRTAQRRPGREPRRHFPARDRLRDALSRSTKAGARTPATRRAPP